tara:strand:- start:1494 stop:1706 length:213 start_codon:yes stop_codon:yes gene_type:complete
VGEEMLYSSAKWQVEKEHTGRSLLCQYESRKEETSLLEQGLESVESRKGYQVISAYDPLCKGGSTILIYF